MNIDKALNILEDAITYNSDGSCISGKSWQLSDDGKQALEVAIKQLIKLKHKLEPQYDFQGWEQKPQTFRDLLVNLNIKKENDTFIIDECEKILDKPICILQDDGMGYGAVNGVAFDVYQDDEEIQIWF